MTVESPVLELDGFGVAFGQKVVLADVTLCLRGPGITAVMGPGGSGKSTFLRTIAGLNDAQPIIRMWGVAKYAGATLGEAPRPYIVAQKAKLLISTVRENVASSLPRWSSLTTLEQNAVIERALAAVGVELPRSQLDSQAVALPLVEQRLLALACASCQDATLLLVDEITADLEEPGAARVIAALRALARDRTVLFVTHHRGHARAASTQVALFAGGRVIECTPTEEFFTAARSQEGRTFAETGGCAVPGPMAEAEMLDEGVTASPLPPRAVVALRAAPVKGAPTGFFWLAKGKLAGMARPGLLEDVGVELGQLEGLGVTDLVTLEEQPTVRADLAAGYGLRVHHFPIVDMRAPTIDDTRSLHARVAAWTNEGRVVGFHCRAGLGRTGTMLVAMNILSGQEAVSALAEARNINPAWVQSEAQLAFLIELGNAAQPR